MKPTIQIETIEKLTEGINGRADLDDLIQILKEDVYWKLASIEQCEKFLAEFLVKLNQQV